ncbi:MAG: hypothetical protein L0Z53_03930 [Acidobacteriales bacterium]|nr:hypothetical protein [Terriglobales bacterium]
MTGRKQHWVLIRALALTFVAAAVITAYSAGPNNGPKVELDAAAAQPRQLEDTTEVAIARDYSAAWKALATAMSENRSDALNAGFIGVARNNLGNAIEDQKKAGLRRRYTDRGHKLTAIFYSPEGSAMQLRDTAQYDLEILDGETVIDRQQLTEAYLVLMTVAEGSWKVRSLESLPK